MKKALTYSIICFLLVILSGIASIAIYRWCPLCVDELKEIGPAGDAIAGISAIILGAFGVAATFAAFYIQYKANISLHNDSLKEGFDRKFFELVNLFAQSTNTLQIKVKKTRNFNDKTGEPYEYIQGKNVFQHFHDDFIFPYHLLLDCFDKKSNLFIDNTENFIRIAFLIVYFGQNHPEAIKATKVLETLLVSQREKDYESFDIAITESKFNQFKNSYDFNQDDFSYNEVLCHYFKQIYFIAKFVINSKETPYEQKKIYFDMLRSQLSYNEQLMLFYSWCAGIEKELNKTQIKQIFCEYGLINDILENEKVDGLDISTIINEYKET